MNVKKNFLPVLAGYLVGLATAGVIAIAVSKDDVPSYGTPAASADSSVGETVNSGGTGASQAPANPAPSVPVNEMPQHAGVPLSAEAQSQIAPLQSRLAADPGDLAARKRMAVILLQNQHLMAAYEHATAILNTDPDDPDGLYVHGVVRLAMGHAPRAIELLDRVLAQHPNHLMALQARAQAQRKIGDEGGAALTETRAREAARGNKSDVDQLLAAASDGSLFEMMRSGSATSAPAEGEGSSTAGAESE